MGVEYYSQDGPAFFYDYRYGGIDGTNAQPYRYTRNPMYISVALILLGWALSFGLPGLYVYAMSVIVAFHLRVVFGEEPWLARTHGARWDEYARRYLDEIAEQRETIRRLGERLARGETITLLCSSACVDPARCHRTLLAEKITRASPVQRRRR